MNKISLNNDSYHFFQLKDGGYCKSGICDLQRTRSRDTFGIFQKISQRKFTKLVSRFISL